ncbi:MAG: lactonase family protein [Candidatus Cyclobacteriaceae bacterium M3_2C_046]
MSFYNIRLWALLLVVSCNTTKKEQNTTTMDQQDKSQLIFIGTYTGNQSEGVYFTRFHPEQGILSQPILAASTSNPSFLAINRDQQMIYAVNEKDSGMVSAFQWNPDNQSLEMIDQQSSYGSYPCYVDINPSGDKLALANYGSGTVAFYNLENGQPTDTTAVHQHKGKGPNQSRQEGPHAHFSKFVPQYNLIYTVDLGIDQVMAYPANEEGEGFTALKLEGGSGPRHLAFHPEKDLVFIINELSSTIVSARVDRETGKFTMIDQASTLPADYKEENSCADIHISQDGKYLYGSNRGHNSIAIFMVGEDGTLQLKKTEPVRGDWPRNFALSPDGQFLIVANQRSNNIVVFKVNPETGLLTYNQNQITVGDPVCLKFY